jgi:hypothetical protein
MLDESLFVVKLSLEAQVHPHRLLDRRLTDVHNERIRQVTRPIFPRAEWRI